MPKALGGKSYPLLSIGAPGEWECGEQSPLYQTEWFRAKINFKYHKFLKTNKEHLIKTCSTDGYAAYRFAVLGKPDDDVTDENLFICADWIKKTLPDRTLLSEDSQLFISIADVDMQSLILRYISRDGVLLPGVEEEISKQMETVGIASCVSFKEHSAIIGQITIRSFSSTKQTTFVCITVINREQQDKCEFIRKTCEKMLDKFDLVEFD